MTNANTLSIIIPIYNEERTLRTVVDRIRLLGAPIEIILVDDGSTDGTPEIVRSYEAQGIAVRTHRKNMGKGKAIATGVAIATGEVVAIQDADLEYNPDELLTLAEPILEHRADIVFGSRFLKKNPTLYWRYYFGNILMSFLISAIVFRKITDTYTCYKLFRRDIIQSFKLFSRGFEVEAELSVRTAKSPYRFIELPISYTPRSITEGKKISWKDGIKGLITAVKTRLIA
ncbi:MAG: glycosyltransferase [Elusimicrobia bacterium]|nr:glycosyltransferase [Elusimicrobiota bacterium]MBD3412249.1 glycosyltransferase [Elusimicrobiota bacterium]